MPLDTSGLRKLDTEGLQRLNTDGLTRLDTSGLTPFRSSMAHPSLIDQAKAGFDEYRANRQSARALGAARTAVNVENFRAGDPVYRASLENLRGQARLYRARGEVDEAEKVETRIADAEDMLQNPDRLERFDQARADLTEMLQGAIDRRRELRTSAAQVPYSQSTQETLSAEGFGEAFGEFTDDPLRFIAEVGTRSAPNMLEIIPAAIGGSLVGGPAGAAVGTFMGSSAVEYRASMDEYLSSHGVDMESADSILDAMADEELMGEAYKYAATRAGIIGTMDTASLGLAGRVIGPATRPILREMTNVAAQTGIQAAAGAAGEAGAIAATEGLQEVGRRGGDILAEAAGEAVTAPVDIAVAAGGGLRSAAHQRLREKRQRAREGEQMTSEDISEFVRERRIELEAVDSPTPDQQQELDFLRENGGDLQTVADVYQIDIDATTVTPESRLTQDDIESPLPNDLIAEGKELIEEALDERIEPETTEMAPTAEPLKTTGLTPFEPDRVPQETYPARPAPELQPDQVPQESYPPRPFTPDTVPREDLPLPERPAAVPSDVEARKQQLLNGLDQIERDFPRQIQFPFVRNTLDLQGIDSALGEMEFVAKQAEARKTPEVATRIRTLADTVRQAAEPDAGTVEEVTMAGPLSSNRIRPISELAEDVVIEAPPEPTSATVTQLQPRGEAEAATIAPTRATEPAIAATSERSGETIPSESEALTAAEQAWTRDLTEAGRRQLLETTVLGDQADRVSKITWSNLSSRDREQIADALPDYQRSLESDDSVRDVRPAGAETGAAVQPGQQPGSAPDAPVAEAGGREPGTETPAQGVRTGVPDTDAAADAEPSLAQGVARYRELSAQVDTRNTRSPEARAAAEQLRGLYQRFGRKTVREALASEPAQQAPVTAPQSPQERREPGPGQGRAEAAAAPEPTQESTQQPPEQAGTEEDARYALDESRREQYEASLKDLQDRLEEVGLSRQIAVRLRHRLPVKGTRTGARGRYLGRVIEIAMDTADKQWTLNHEIVHALRDLGVLRQTEWSALSRAARADKARMESVRRRYKRFNLSDESLLEEAVADMHADWKSGEMKAKGLLRKAFQRIGNFLEALGNALRGNGFQSAADVFGRIDRGEVGARTAETAQDQRLQPQFAAGRSVPQFDPQAAARLRQRRTQGSQPPPGPVPNQPPIFTNGFSAVDESLLDIVRQKLQDKFIDLRRLQESRGQIPDDMNAYVVEELYHGKAETEIEEAREQHMKPLIDAIQASGLTVAEADEYLYARHAKERNARIAQINPLFAQGGGSGITDAEASQILAQYRGNQKVQRIGQIVDQIAQTHRDLLVSSGLEQAATVQAWEAMYQHYVPLKGDPSGTATRPAPGRGRGFDVRGRTKAATGRRSRAQSVVANLLAQYETDIIRSQKAKVGRALLRFVQANPDPQLWEIDKVTYQGTVNKASGLVQYRPDNRYQLADNVLVVKVNGVDHHITFHGNRGARIASAMKNMGAANAGGAIRAFASVNRVLSALNTSLNPEFVISNLARDLQTAGLNLAGTQADGIKTQILKDVGKAWHGIRRAQKGKGGQWAQYFSEFRKAGGKTGWTDAHGDVDRLHSQLEKEIARHQQKKLDPRRLVQKLGQFIEAVNIAVENAVRLSAFVHARHSGLSEQQAASLAKNLTVNFNRKGEYGVLMNSLYLFYNASIQGNVRLLQALKSPKVRKLAGGIVVFAAMLDILNRTIGGEDDDDIPRYDKIPPWVKERNLIVMNPWSEEGYFKIPLPWGYNIFHVIGQEVGESISAGMGQQPDYRPMDSAVSILSAIAGSFNPLGSDSTLSQLLSPTVTDPIVSLGENLDWAGRPIAPEDNPFADAPSPDSQKYWSTTGEIPKAIAETLNRLTGGSEVRPGAIDVAPTTLEYLYEFATGGAGRFLQNTIDAPIKQLVEGEVDSYKIPFVRQVYGDVGSQATQEKFYDNIEQVYYADQELKLATELGDRQMQRRIRENYGPWLRSRLAAGTAESALRALRERRNELRARQNISESSRRRQLRRVEDQMEREMLRFNRRVRQRQ